MTEVVGPALVLDDGLSLWGGIDPATGVVIDTHHPQRGAIVTGRVLVMRSGRGSSSSASVLAEAVRAGTAPAAIVLLEADLILSIGSAVAEELYGVAVPVVVIGPETYAAIGDGETIRVADDGAGYTAANGQLGAPRDRGSGDRAGGAG